MEQKSFHLNKDEVDIIFLSGVNWSFLKQGQQYIAEQYKKAGYNVLFIEPILHRKVRLSDYGNILNRLFKRKENISGSNDLAVDSSVPHILSPVTLPDTNTIFRQINRLLFLPYLLRKVKRHLKQEHTVCYVWWPTNGFMDFLSLLTPDRLVYSCSENFSGMDNLPAGLCDNEKVLAENADVMFVTSSYLLNRWKNIARCPVILRKRAVDYELFSQADTGPTRKIKSIISYGGFSSRIDFDLINAIAASGILITLVGPMRISPHPDLHENVSHVDAVQPEELPSYIAHHDAILWPYKINDLTRGIFPAKIYECLSTGKPIFSSALPSLEKSAQEHGIYIAENSEEIIQQISSFVAEDDLRLYRARKDIALMHSWEKCIEDELFSMLSC